MSEKNDLLPMFLEGVRIEMTTQKPIILLREEDGSRYLPIWIGPYEATAIALEMAGIRTPRPMTHDLIKTIFATFGASIDKVVVDDLRDNTFYATIFVTWGKGTFEIGSRPSDAIAIAVRQKCPIYAAKEVVNSAGIIITSIDEEVEKFKDFLDNLKPEDFNT
jgi:bifunctional DNase/RNase